MPNVRIVFFTTVAAVVFSSLGFPQAPPAKAPPATRRAAPQPLPRGLYATFYTSKGNIVCRLFEKDAPKTVQNFSDLASGKKEWLNPETHTKTSKPLYAGTIFHRVIPNFMIQGGDPLGTGMGDPGYEFEDEINPQRTFEKPGILAMANSGPNTNGSQFFITVAPTDWLNGKHTIFGEVVRGYSVVERISHVPAAETKPNVPVKLLRVRIWKIPAGGGSASAPKRALSKSSGNPAAK